jgi:hypothetical protein
MSIMSFIRMMLKKGHLEKNGNNLNRFFNFKFRYIDDGLSTNKCHDCVDRIYSIELEIKDDKDTENSASYLHLHLDMDSEGQRRANLLDTWNDLNLSIVIFQFIYLCIW